MVQLESREFRDLVLNTFRKYSARSALPGRVRKPKLKDVKHLLNIASRI